ncbi:amidase domain-containing protein [Microbacterium aurum]
MNGKARRTTVSALTAMISAFTLSSAFLPGTANAEFGPFERLETAKAAVKYIDFPYVIPWSDCTYYVSSALWDGGMAPTEDWTPETSDESKIASSKIVNPGPSKAAAHADTFKNYMRNTGRAVVREVKWSDQSAGSAELADVIAYDWNKADGSIGADGVVDHLAIVTSFTDDGYPLVSQHSPTRLNRYWSYNEGADEFIEFTHPGSRVYLIHFL